jgi:hypothetical protein
MGGSAEMYLGQGGWMRVSQRLKGLPGSPSALSTLMHLEEFLGFQRPLASERERKGTGQSWKRSSTSTMGRQLSCQP